MQGIEKEWVRQENSIIKKYTLQAYFGLHSVVNQVLSSADQDNTRAIRYAMQLGIEIPLSLIFHGFEYVGLQVFGQYGKLSLQSDVLTNSKVDQLSGGLYLTFSFFQDMRLMKSIIPYVGVGIRTGQATFTRNDGELVGYYGLLTSTAFKLGANYRWNYNWGAGFHVSQETVKYNTGEGETPISGTTNKVSIWDIRLAGTLNAYF